ncbi:MAG TPA: aminopeptidase P family protein [Clostridiales bacterium]|jgi:Xaa-Pro aminopeptidase|nr:aminopeptidase P family protein [Clostridiales bacterium]
MTHLEKLKSVLGGANPDAVIISSGINQRYISGFPFTDGYLLVTRGKSYLVTDFRYEEAARAGADPGLEVSAPQHGMLDFIAERIFADECRSVAFEEEALPYAAYEKFRAALPGVELVPVASAILWGLREIKDDNELKNIAAAQDIADAAFEHILKFIKPDMTEREVALELEFFMRGQGAEAMAFETIAVSGSASSMPHGVPRDRKLERGFLTMDFGAKVNGYCSDMTRTVVLGSANADMKRLYNTVLSAQLAALEVIREGAGLSEVDLTARGIIDRAGYEGCFGHKLGHGVGLFIHENPRLSPTAPEDARLVSGQVVTVEPGIYIAGKYGCRIEDLVCVTKDGLINLTHSPKELIELF